MSNFINSTILCRAQRAYGLLAVTLAGNTPIRLLVRLIYLRYTSFPHRLLPGGSESVHVVFPLYILQVFHKFRSHTVLLEYECVIVL